MKSEMQNSKIYIYSKAWSLSIMPFWYWLLAKKLIVPLDEPWTDCEMSTYTLLQLMAAFKSKFFWQLNCKTITLFIRVYQSNHVLGNINSTSDK